MLRFNKIIAVLAVTSFGTFESSVASVAADDIRALINIQQAKGEQQANRSVQKGATQTQSNTTQTTSKTSAGLSNSAP